MSSNPSDPVSLEMLLSPIGNADDVRFEKVVQLLDATNSRPEIQQALAELRPRIVRVRPLRRPTAQRVLYLPIEDLLTVRDDAAGCGLIRRKAASLAADYLKRQEDGGPWREFDATLHQISPGDHEKLDEIGVKLWPWAAALLAPAVAQATTDRRIARELLGDARETLPDLRQMAQFLHMGADIQKLKAGLPPGPMRELLADEIAESDRIIRKAAAGDPDRLYVLLFIILQRMSIPGEFLEYANAYFLGLPAEIKDSVMGRLNGVVLSDMDRRTDDLVIKTDIDAEQRARTASRLVTALTAAERFSTTRQDLAAKQELATLRRKATAVIRQIVEGAAASVEDAYKDENVATLEGRKSAEKSLAALRKVQSFAEKVALRGTVDRAVDAAAAEAVRRAEKAMLAAAQNTAAGQASLRHRQEIIAAIRALETIGHNAEADRLRRASTNLFRS